MFRRHPIALLATLVSVPLLAAGCGEDEKATPQVVFDGTMGPASTLEPDEKQCGETGALFTIGQFGNPALDPPVPSSPVKDGDPFEQGSVGVTCAVTPAGTDEFDVLASVTLTGATGGTFTLRQARVKTTGEQTQISATWGKRTGAGIYDQKDGGCVLRYTTPYQGVAAGRIWGELTCSKGTNSGTQTACSMTAQIRLENCDQ